MVGLTEFSAAAELSLSVPSSETRRVRNHIERELGDVRFDGGTAAPTGAATGRQSLGSASAGFSRQQENLVDLAQTRNELLEDIADDAGGGGGLGFGAGAAAGLGVPGAASAATGLGAAGVAAAAQHLIQSLVAEHVPGGADAISGRRGALTEGGIDAGVAGFKNVLDPTGTGEALASSLFEIEPITVEPDDLVGDTPDIGVSDIIPNVDITKRDVLDTLFGGGGGSNTTTTNTNPFNFDITIEDETPNRPPRPRCGVGFRAVWSSHNNEWRCVKVNTRSSSRTMPGTGGRFRR